MFRELNAMIDQLHTATQGQPFAAVRIRLAMDEFRSSIDKFKENIGKALLPFIK